MDELEHDPSKLVFREAPEPKLGKPFSIWQMFQERFAGMSPDVMYFDWEQNLWVIEIQDSTHTVAP